MYHTGVAPARDEDVRAGYRPLVNATLLPLFLMWTEMMVAMMIPSAAPMILTFAMVNRKPRRARAPLRFDRNFCARISRRVDAFQRVCGTDAMGLAR